MATLVQEGGLDQDEQRRYGLGVRLLILGTRVMNHLHIGDVADRDLQDLPQRVRETAHLAMVVGAEAGYLKKVDAEHSIRVGSRAGMHVPLHASAVGKTFWHTPEVYGIRYGERLSSNVRREPSLTPNA